MRYSTLTFQERRQKLNINTPTTRSMKNIVIELCCSTSGDSGISSVGRTGVGAFAVGAAMVVALEFLVGAIVV